MLMCGIIFVYEEEEEVVKKTLWSCDVSCRLKVVTWTECNRTMMINLQFTLIHVRI